MKSLFQTILAALFALAAVTAHAAEFTVSNTNNAGTGSLRQAIADANTNPGSDRIVFNIPGDGLQVIRLTNALPELNDPVEIDGYTQPGSSPNTLADADNAVRSVELDGVSSGFYGFVLRTSNSVVRGLSIRRCASGIEIQGSHNLVVGNILGSDASPSYYNVTNDVPGNDRGLTIGSTCCDASNICCNIIGGVRPADRNVIAGNLTNPIRIGDGVEVADTTILGNFIGVDSSGTRPSGGQGSSPMSVHTVKGLTIGGLEEGARNVMASYSMSTITLYEKPGRVDILGNYMGVGADGVTAFPRTVRGVFIFFGGDDFEPVVPANCRIEGNRIANCYIAVSVDEFLNLSGGPGYSANRVTVSRNSIYANTNWPGPSSPPFGGIWLGAAAKVNDPLDLDSGANDRQNYPELSSAIYGESNMGVSGLLRSGPSSTYRIEFFANTVPHPSGFGEGETYLGFTNVTTDINGTAPFEVTLPGVLALQPYITATATDPDGNTSMFSRPVHGRSPGAVLFHLHHLAALHQRHACRRRFGCDTSHLPMAVQWRRPSQRHQRHAHAFQHRLGQPRHLLTRRQQLLRSC